MKICSQVTWFIWLCLQQVELRVNYTNILQLGKYVFRGGLSLNTKYIFINFFSPYNDLFKLGLNIILYLATGIDFSETRHQNIIAMMES